MPGRRRWDSQQPAARHSRSVSVDAGDRRARLRAVGIWRHRQGAVHGSRRRSGEARPTVQTRRPSATSPTTRVAGRASMATRSRNSVIVALARVVPVPRDGSVTGDTAAVRTRASSSGTPPRNRPSFRQWADRPVGGSRCLPVTVPGAPRVARPTRSGESPVSSKLGNRLRAILRNQCQSAIHSVQERGRVALCARRANANVSEAIRAAGAGSRFPVIAKWSTAATE